MEKIFWIQIRAWLLKWKISNASWIKQKEKKFENCSSKIKIIQWAPLNGITDNGISRLLGSDFTGPICCTLYNNVWKQLVNRIIRLMKSDMVCPKVIPLSGTYCIGSWVKSSTEVARLLQSQAIFINFKCSLSGKFIWI